MKLQQFMIEEELNEAKPYDLPPAIMWSAPSGSVVECPSEVIAQRAAEKFAARCPGTTVAVYQLVGYAFSPIKDDVDFIHREDSAVGRIAFEHDGDQR